MKTSRDLLLEMNVFLTDFHTNIHGETQQEKGKRCLIALKKAEKVYLDLVEHWALENPHPMHPSFIRKEGRLFVRQYCKGTLARYVPLEKYHTFSGVYDPLLDYDRVLMRERALGLGEIEWKLSVLEGANPYDDDL